MESVLAHQEDMAQELKELLQKGIFSQEEVKQIIVKRTAYESALVRIHPKKSDYLRYIEYLMALEALRKKRVKRLRINLHVSSLANFCFVRAQYYIYERAVQKFKDDVGLWVQFIKHAKRQHAHALAGRVAARAIQLHPSSIPLYVLAASNQLHAGSPSAARTIFQRGLRLNSDSTLLWTEYVKMELEYIETRRRELAKLKEMREQIANMDGEEKDDEELSQEPPEDDEQMKEIMDGAIVKEVIQNAIKAHPKVDMFSSLHNALSTYPTPCKTSLLELLATLLSTHLPNNARAIRLGADWSINPDQKDFIERLREANTKFANAVTSSDVNKEEIGVLYSEWIIESVERIESDALKLYLIRFFHTLVSTLPQERLVPKLLATDLQLSASRDHDTSKLTKRARKYINVFPSSSEIWLQYLSLLGSSEDDVEKDRVWREARSKAKGSTEDLAQIWLWLEPTVKEGKSKERMYEDILKSSIQHASPELHPHLLMSYIERLYQSPTDRLKSFSKIIKQYLPSDACYRFAFDLEVHSETPSKEVLELLHGRWRQISGCEIESALRFAAWLLLQNGDGKGAKEVVDRTRAILDEEGRGMLDEHWTAIVNGDEDEDEEMTSEEDLPAQEHKNVASTVEETMVQDSVDQMETEYISLTA